MAPSTAAADSADDAGPRPWSTRVDRRGLLLDGLIALVLAGLVVAHGILVVQLPFAAEFETPTTVTFVSGAVMCLALAVRRLYPVTVFVVVCIAFTVYGFNQGYDVLSSSIAVFIATVTAGADGPPKVRDWARGIVIAALFGTVFYALYVADRQDMPLLALWLGQVYALVLNVFYFAAAWILGNQIRIRRERETELADRTAELTARTRELEAERAVTAEKATVEERLRIARELHDVLGHHVSVMGVQAGAARRIVDRDPVRAVDALQAIEDSSRHAVTELQRVLELLRDDDQRPVPLGGLARLEESAAEIRRAGVDVTVHVPPLPPLPVEVELAALRVVQESLTNVLRHAGPGTSAWVTAQVDDRAVHVEIGDDGRGTPWRDPRDGGDATATAGTRSSGVQGMRERVALYGGSFHAGPASPRGWRVTATIPLGRGPDRLEAGAGAGAGSSAATGPTTAAPLGRRTTVAPGGAS